MIPLFLPESTVFLLAGNDFWLFAGKMLLQAANQNGEWAGIA